MMEFDEDSMIIVFKKIGPHRGETNRKACANVDVSTQTMNQSVSRYLHAVILKTLNIAHANVKEYDQAAHAAQPDHIIRCSHVCISVDFMRRGMKEERRNV